MRLIDADALTEKCGDWYVEEGTEEGFIGTIKQLIDAQPTVQPEQQWIPCSERLPENDDDVIVQMNDGSMMVDCRAASSNGWFWAELGDEPVAWMPLPEPYQEGGEHK